MTSRVYRMYLKFLQKPRCLGWFKTSQALGSAVKKTRVNSSFVHKKETEHSFELSLSICVYYRFIFNLEIQNFSLENHHMMNARQPFCWWMTFTKVSNPPLPPPTMWLTTWLLWSKGYGRFSLGKNFFPKSVELKNFFYLTFNSVVLYTLWAIFFQCRILFFPVMSLQAFSPRNQSARYFFWNHL